MEGYNIEKEMREAIEAGENALYSLRAAKEELRKAGNWGIADLLGGGFFVSLIKHSKMDEASRLMEQARYDLKKFQKFGCFFPGEVVFLPEFLVNRFIFSG